MCGKKLPSHQLQNHAECIFIQQRLACPACPLCIVFLSALLRLYASLQVEHHVCVLAVLSEMTGRKCVSSRYGE